MFPHRHQRQASVFAALTKCLAVTVVLTALIGCTAWAQPSDSGPPNPDALQSSLATAASDSGMHTGTRILVEASSVVTSIGAGAALGIWTGDRLCVPPPPSDSPWSFAIFPRCFDEQVFGGLLGGFFGFAMGLAVVRTFTQGPGTLAGAVIGGLVGAAVGLTALAVADSPWVGVPIALSSTLGGMLIGYAASTWVTQSNPSLFSRQNLAFSISPMHGVVLLSGRGRF